MNRIIKILILIIVIILIIVLIPKGEKVSIPTYESDIICTKNFSELNENDINVETKSNIFISLDNNKNVKKVIIQNIENGNIYSIEDSYLIKNLYDEYNKIDGIKATIDYLENEIIYTVIYDYLEINLNQLKKKLNSFVEDTIYDDIKELPFTYDFYHEYELKDYDCKKTKKEQ